MSHCGKNYIAFRDGVNGKTGARAVWGSQWRRGLVGLIKLLHHVGSKPGPVEVRPDDILSDFSLKVDAKKPLHCAHEVNGQCFYKESFKLALNLVRGGEIDKVINVDAKSEVNHLSSVRRVIMVPNKPSEEAWVVQV